MPSIRTRLDTLQTQHSLRLVLFVSQRQAETMCPPMATALISITDPSRPIAAIGEGWAAILRVKFDDVDPVTFPGQDQHLQGITSDEVARVAAFAAMQAKTCQRLVVHCRHGVSRSAAVAKAIAETAGVRFPSDYDEYNRFVYLSLRKAVHYAFTEA